MLLRNTDDRYGLLAILLHWIMAIIMIGLIVMGLYMVRISFSPLKLELFGWHKEYGELILGLASLRLVWRLLNRVPVLPSTLANWQKWAAHAVHYAFYFFMFALPITGWIISSAAGLPVSFFGWFVLPDLVSANESTRDLFQEIHKWLAYGLIATICAHVGAALEHHFIHKDNILRRMFP